MKYIHIKINSGLHVSALPKGSGSRRVNRFLILAIPGRTVSIKLSILMRALSRRNIYGWLDYALAPPWIMAEFTPVPLVIWMICHLGASKKKILFLSRKKRRTDYDAQATSKAKTFDGYKSWCKGPSPRVAKVFFPITIEGGKRFFL